MSRHCQHSSTAKIVLSLHFCYAANAMNYLFNHEASQSKYGACLSAAGDKAEFLYSAFAEVEMLQFNSS
jgi:hypothetical protein